MKDYRFPDRRGQRRATFAMLLNDTRLLAAERAWQRATNASVLRYAAVDPASRKTLDHIKVAAIGRALRLAPGHVLFRIHGNFRLGAGVWPGYGGPLLG